MKKIALTQLAVARTDKYLFQRRDGKTEICPYRLSLFAVEISDPFSPGRAMKTELEQKTRLHLGRLVLLPESPIRVPAERSSSQEEIDAYLFRTTVRVGDAEEILQQSQGCMEIHTIPELLERNDVSATARFILEQT